MTHTHTQEVGLGHLLLSPQPQPQPPPPAPSSSPLSPPPPSGLLAVADWGRRLSRGERQRVALARALYHEPKVSK
jgi:ABC-type uncharacterized transport system fused permease/ATPase subunit